VRVQSGSCDRFFGFKIVFPTFYPFSAPWVFLDEKEDPQIIEFMDYIEKGNRLSLLYLDRWDQEYRPGSHQYSLPQLMQEVYQAFQRSPPIPFSEL